MPLQYPLVDVADIAPQPGPDTADGPANELRLAIKGSHGSSTAAFHLVARSGLPGAHHLHRDCDEITIQLTGTGIAGQGEGRADMRAGHCRLIPKGTPHYFVPHADSQNAVSVSFLLGAAEPSASGFESLGQISLDDAQATPKNAITQGLVVHLDDVAPENMDAGAGWSITDFRLPIAGHNGASSTLFRARFFPGAIHKKHRHDNCEEIYYVISGHGLAGAGPDRVEVHGGQFHYIPRGVEHWLHNLSDSEPIEVVGIYLDADSVAATGYVYMGEVDEADLAARPTN